MSRDLFPLVYIYAMTKVIRKKRRRNRCHGFSTITVVWSQVRMPEFSVKFFNVSYHWQLADARRTPFGRQLPTACCSE